MARKIGDNLKLALGMITKDLLTVEPLDQFLDNSEKFNHRIDSVVIGYADKIDPKVVEALEKRVDVHLVKIRKSVKLYQKLADLGMTKEEIVAAAEAAAADLIEDQERCTQ